MSGLGSESPAKPGEVIDGRYSIEREVGRGGMGVVLLGRDVELDRRVALKIVTPELTRDPAIVEGFRREARALAGLRSAHVVQVYAFGPHKDAFYFAMEFVDGPSLETLMEEHQKNNALIPLDRSFEILKAVASGLDAVHAGGLVHRDVKPANIIIEQRSGRPVLIDFGLAHAEGHVSQIQGGTPGYMSPEQANHELLGPPADTYALAAATFELFTGRLPFEAQTVHQLFLKQQTEAPTLLSTYRPELKKLDGVFMRGLAKLPETRFQRAGQFMDAVGSLLTLPKPAAAAEAAPEAGFDQSKLQVLIVDDDPVFRRFAGKAAAFGTHGMDAQVSVAESGAAALEIASRRTPQLLLLDYDMPGMNGVAFLTALRALPRGGETLVIVASATAGETERWRFGVLGVNDFLRKPVQMVELISAVERLALATGAPRKTLANWPKSW